MCYFSMFNVSLKDETTTSEKLTRKARRHVLWCGLESYLPPCSLLSTWTLVTKPRPRSNRQRRSCLVPVESSWPQVGHQRWPCLVSNHAAMTSIWLSMTTMLGPHTIATTMNWLQVIALLGPTSTIGLRPWVSCQRLLCLVLKWLATNDTEARLKKS